MVGAAAREAGAAVTPGPHRVEALDAFRGLAVASMILVNNPGSWDHVFEPLQHAGWNDWTFADLIFPCFIFILGMAIPFAFGRFAADGGRRSRIHPRIWRRAAVLILLGLLLNLLGTSDPAAVRIPGVLQRLGLVYAAAAMLTLYAGPPMRIAVATGVLLLHWALLVLTPFGGLPAMAPIPAHNLATYLDARLFGRHMLTAAGDPEGLLGTLPAIATALIGTLAGDWLRREQSRARTVIGLTVAGAGLVAGGIGWALVLPVNKPLWTGSFVLVAGGSSLVMFALCYLVVDVAGVRGWARPFVWLGINPLAIYFLSELAGELIERPWRWQGAEHTAKSWLYWTLLEPRLAPRIGSPASSLVFAFAVVAFWLAVAAALQRRNLRIVF
jgi:predicted acyltransferase